MQRILSLASVNHHLMCVLCGGYLMDATTISECLHSFCRACIVRYLETSYNCPVCDTEIHKTKPLSNIRSDPTLQEIVLKLVPDLYRKEEERRCEFIKSQTLASESDQPGPSRAKTHQNKETSDKVFVTLKYFRGPSRYQRHVKVLSLFPTRYLCCPRNVPVKVLKKFIRMKFDLPHDWQVEVWKTDESLLDTLVLSDVIRIFGAFRERTPLELQFSVTPPSKANDIKPTNEEPIKPQMPIIQNPIADNEVAIAVQQSADEDDKDEIMTDLNEEGGQNEQDMHDTSPMEEPKTNSKPIAEDKVMTSVSIDSTPLLSTETEASEIEISPLKSFPVNTPLLSSLKRIEALTLAASSTSHTSPTAGDAENKSQVFPENKQMNTTTTTQSGPISSPTTDIEYPASTIADNAPTSSTVDDRVLTSLPVVDYVQTSSIVADNVATYPSVADYVPTSSQFINNVTTYSLVADYVPTSSPVADNVTVYPPVTDNVIAYPLVADYVPTSSPVANNVTAYPPVADYVPTSSPVADNVTAYPPVADYVPRVADNVTTYPIAADYVPTSSPVADYKPTSMNDHVPIIVDVRMANVEDTSTAHVNIIDNISMQDNA